MNPIFLREAIQLSIENVARNAGGPFGAVVVQDDKVVGRGWNQVTTTCDPTAHAEVVAIRDACSRLKSFSLAGCVLYTSCEPCPMCLAAAYWSRLDRICYAASAADAAAAGFDDENFYAELRKPVSERRIPMQQALREEAGEAFQAWKKSSDKIQY